MQTRLETCGNFLQSVFIEKIELCRSYRDHGETYVKFHELCDAQHRYYNAKMDYVKQYHGNNYEQLDQTIKHYRRQMKQFFHDQESPEFTQAYNNLNEAERTLFKCTDPIVKTIRL